MSLNLSYPIMDWKHKHFNKSVAKPMSTPAPTPLPEQPLTDILPVGYHAYTQIMSEINNVSYHTMGNIIRGLNNLLNENNLYDKLTYVVQERQVKSLTSWKSRFMNALNVPVADNIKREDSKATGFKFVYKGVLINVCIVPDYLHINNALSLWTNGGILPLLQIFAKSLGLTMDHKGTLTIPVMYKGEQRDILEVTSDLNTIITSILGAHPYLFANYSKTYNDVFQYITRSPYYSRELFLANLSAAEPLPVDPELVIVAKFVEHTTSIPGIPANSPVFVKTKPWIKDINRIFGNTQETANTMISEWTKEDMILKKLNMPMIEAAMECSPQMALKVFNHIRDSFDSYPEYEIFVMSSLPETILEKVKKTFDICNVPELIKLDRNNKKDIELLKEVREEKQSEEGKARKMVELYLPTQPSAESNVEVNGLQLNPAIYGNIVNELQRFAGMNPYVLNPAGEILLTTEPQPISVISNRAINSGIGF